MSASENSAPGWEPSLKEATVTHVRASITRGLQRRVMAGGPENWEAVLAEVSGPCRAIFSKPLGVFQWVDVALVNELGQAYNRIGGGEDLALRAALTAEEHLTISHPWLLKLLSPETLVRQGPTLFHFYHRGGVVRTDAFNPGDGEYSIWATGLYDGWASTAIPAWLTRALQLTGAEQVSVAHTPPPEGSLRHRYRLTWRA